MRLLTKFSRRQLLGSGAAAAALAPFIPMLDSHAGADGIPTRFIVMFTPTGTVLEDWRPTGTTDAWEFSPILAPIEQAPGGSLKDRVIVLDGIDDEAAHHVIFHPQKWGYGGHHAICSLLSGQTPLLLADDEFAGAGISIDQYLGNQLEGQTPHKTLQFAVDHRPDNHWENRISYTGPQSPVQAIEDPALMLENIYGDLDLDESELDRLKASRLSVIDAVADDLKRLQQRMAKSDKVKVDAHLAAIRDLELKIGAGSLACEPPEPTTLQPLWDGTPENSKNMQDLMVAALACDATRVATLMYSWENSGMIFPWLDLGVEDTRLHGMSHEAAGAGRAGFAGAQTWFAEEFAALLTKLDAVPQPDGNSLLSHTVVLWVTTMSHSGHHASRNIPVVLGGEGGGYFETGRYHRYGSYPLEYSSGSEPHFEHGGKAINDLYLSIIHAMGFPEVETFGDPAFCSGPLL